MVCFPGRAQNISLRTKSRGLIAGIVLLILGLGGEPGLAGEVMALHPIFTEKDAVLERTLMGSWREEGSGDLYTFKRTGDNFLSLTLNHQGISSQFEAILTRLAGLLLLDLVPVAPDGNNFFYKDRFLPLHSFYAITIAEDTLRAAPVNDGGLYDLLNDKNSKLTLDRHGKNLLLTGATSELRAFFQQYGEEARLFSGPISLARQQPPPEETATSFSPPNMEASRTSRTDEPGSAAFRGCRPQFPAADGWLGADASISIPIAAGQDLWIFSDTFVGKAGQTSRQGAQMVANSIAISSCDAQKGWTIEYHWRNKHSDSPQPFFRSYSDRYQFWPEDVFTHDGALYVALNKVGPRSDGPPDAFINFSILGTAMARIANYQTTPPEQWQIELLPWSSVFVTDSWKCLVKDGAYLYVFVKDKGKKTFLTRFALAQLARPEEASEYLAMDGAWRKGINPEDALPIMDDVISGSGGSVRYHEDLKQWVMIHGPGFPEDRIVMHTAPALAGPWSPATTLMRTPEQDARLAGHDPDTFCYEGREHLQFYDPSRRALLITYDCNSASFAKVVANMDLYFPRTKAIAVPSQALVGQP